MKKLSDYLTHENSAELSELTPIFQRTTRVKFSSFFKRQTPKRKRLQANGKSPASTAQKRRN